VGRQHSPKCVGRLNSMKIQIEYQNQFGKWNHYQTKDNEADAYRVAKSRAKSTGKRHRLVDTSGSLLDLVEPS
jgi:hypothetical protein